LRDDALLDWDSVTAWESFVLRVCETAASPEAALDRLWEAYAELGTWQVMDGLLCERVSGLDPATLGRSTFDRGRAAPALVDSVRLAIPEAFRIRLRSASPSFRLRSAPPSFGETGCVIGEEARAVCRYLGARAIACWPLYQGEGLRTQLLFFEAALALV